MEVSKVVKVKKVKKEGC